MMKPVRKTTVSRMSLALIGLDILWPDWMWAASLQVAAGISPVILTGCYVGDGSATPVACPDTGQDGETGSGINWPRPRFAESGTGTVTDRLTGLVWSKNANPAGRPVSWTQPLAFIIACNHRNYLGHHDWRLPNVNELLSISHHQTDLAGWLWEQGFENLQNDSYWTSTTYAAYPPYDWGIFLGNGMSAGLRKLSAGFVWPVRGGIAGEISLPKTGQTACYSSEGTTVGCSSTSQGGDLQAGVAWPVPRFKDNTDQTVTDRLTGLVWSKNGQTPGPPYCTPRQYKTWPEALSIPNASILGRFSTGTTGACPTGTNWPVWSITAGKMVSTGCAIAALPLPAATGTGRPLRTPTSPGMPGISACRTAPPYRWRKKLEPMSGR